MAFDPDASQPTKPTQSSHLHSDTDLNSILDEPVKYVLLTGEVLAVLYALCVAAIDYPRENRLRESIATEARHVFFQVLDHEYSQEWLADVK